jgi:hypothetical protein
MHWARCLSRRIEKGRAYGEITANALAVLEALLGPFHNAKSGICFPSYEKIAEAASCARSTVADAIKALGHPILQRAPTAKREGVRRAADFEPERGADRRRADKRRYVGRKRQQMDVARPLWLVGDEVMRRAAHAASGGRRLSGV